MSAVRKEARSHPLQQPHLPADAVAPRSGVLSFSVLSIWEKTNNVHMAFLTKVRKALNCSLTADESVAKSDATSRSWFGFKL